MPCFRLVTNSMTANALRRTVPHNTVFMDGRDKPGHDVFLITAAFPRVGQD